MARILGVDYGLRRMGLAVSDPTATLAQPLPALLRRRGKRPPVGAVAALVAEHAAAEVVVGLPLNSEGEEDEWTAEVRAFGERVGERAGVPVHYIDERFTSAAATRAVRSLGLTRTERERKERVDAAAAVLILQSWLDRRRKDDDDPR
jgi:putative Holliday junction resolvase